MTSHDNDPRRRGRVFVYRFRGTPSSWLGKLLALSAVVAVISLLLLLALGLWVVFAVSATVVALAALVTGLIPRRRSQAPPVRGQVVEGEARRIRMDD